MAVKNRDDLSQAFRNDPKLQKFLLSDVTRTGRILGTGPYGSVEEVSCEHLVCAGKKIHDILIDVKNKGVAEVARKYRQECKLMSSLHHPNITQFLGLCFLPEVPLPLLVMERLETSLDDLLKHMPNLPLSLKRSILEDVACGLLYLHNRRPCVIHRDLTSKNVLLTSSLVAKITDIGNSRIVTMRCETLTKYPGTLVYMPPEGQNDGSRYGPSLDVFSFGHLALYTVIQKFPGSLQSVSPEDDQKIKNRLELQRREVYIKQLQQKIQSDYPNLVKLVKQCLLDDPHARPTSEELLTRLQGMRGEIEGEHEGRNFIKLDMIRLRMSKELKEKDGRIKELTQQLEEFRNTLEETSGQLNARETCIEKLQAEIQGKDENITAFKQLIEVKDDLITRKEKKIATIEAELEGSEAKEAELRKEMQTQEVEMTRLREELRLLSRQESAQLKDSLKLTWEPASNISNMSFSMENVQSVVIQNELYVGGGTIDGDKDKDKKYVVMKFSSGKWTSLPSYSVCYFSMTAINNELVLVGGYKDRSCSKKIGVWRAAWVHPYPDLSIARYFCSTIVKNPWLVVAGGQDKKTLLNSVEVHNISTPEQPKSLPRTPVPWTHMRTAVVENTVYFMGGQAKHGEEMPKDTKKVYQVSMEALIAHITSQSTSEGDKEKLWKEIPELQLTNSTPTTINGSLLAVGGMDKDNKAVTAIHLYQPDSAEWVKIADLPSPCSQCACAVIADVKMVVAGGFANRQRVEWARIQRQE